MWSDTDDGSENMIEPSVIHDTFATGIGNVESVCDECVRLTFCVRQQGCDVVVVKVVVPKSLLPNLIATANAAGEKIKKPKRLAIVN